MFVTTFTVQIKKNTKKKKKKEAYASDNSYGIFTDRSIFRLLFPRNRSVPGLHERAPVRKSDFFLVSLLLVK